MSSSAPRIRFKSALLVGTDEMLLYTRKAILEKEGFVVSKVEPGNAMERLKSAAPDVLIACHTLTADEADLVVQAARALPVPPALIGFTKDLSPRPTSQPFDVTVWSLASPESFVGKVREVLAGRGD